jgi:hypothetical protein
MRSALQPILLAFQGRVSGTQVPRRVFITFDVATGAEWRKFLPLFRHFCGVGIFGL